MSDRDRFRCSYCGELARLDRGRIWWTWSDSLPDGTDLWAPSVYCSPYCGQTHATGSVGRS